MSTYYPPGYRQWGRRLNCEKNGCDPKRKEDGRVFPMQTKAEARTNTTINGHKADLVTRVMPDWERSGQVDHVSS